MALRSGYKGFKKLLPGLKIIRPGTLGIDNTELSKTFFPRSEQTVLGAKNWFNYTKGTTTNNGVTFTNVNNQSCVLSGEATADQAAIEMGTLVVDKDTEFIINGASSSNNAKIHIYAYDSTTNARPYTDSSKTTVQTNNCFGTGNNKELPFFAEAGHVIKIYARVQTTGTSVPSDTVFWPMVRLVTDPDPTFAPYAMTNRELTELKLDKLPVEVKGISVDALTDAGFFYCNGNMTGLPYGSIGLMIVFKSPVTTGVQQIYIPAGDVSKTYMRRYWENAWSNWYYYEGTQIQP